LKAREPPHSA